MSIILYPGPQGLGQKQTHTKRVPNWNCLSLTILTHREPATSSKACPAGGSDTSQQKDPCLWCLMCLRSLPNSRCKSISFPWTLKVSSSPREERLLRRAVQAHFDNWCYNKSFGLVPGEDTALHRGTRGFFKCSCSLGPSWDLSWELYGQACISPPRFKTALLLKLFLQPSYMTHRALKEPRVIEVTLCRHPLPCCWTFSNKTNFIKSPAWSLSAFPVQEDTLTCHCSFYTRANQE